MSNFDVIKNGSYEQMEEILLEFANEVIEDFGSFTMPNYAQVERFLDADSKFDIECEN